jgi:antitoxin Phd
MMSLKKWKLQDAKNHFSEVVECAIKEGPQEVTKRGEHAVVILSYALYKELSKPKENLVDFLRNSPFYGVELDLERNKDIPRRIEF